MNNLRVYWGNLRSSFWFMPLLMVLASMAFGVILIEADSTDSDRWLSQWPRLFGTGAEGARLMLSTLAGSMITVMGIIFSMTLLALTLASSQYTSRILRNFMRSRITQFTLGIYAGTFVYCLLVLRTIRGSGGIDEFVPNLAVFFAFVMSLIGVGVLIYFIHHIALSILASSIIASVANETNASIDRLLPEKLDLQPEQAVVKNPLRESLDERTWYSVPAAKSGYIQGVNHKALMRLARDSKSIVRMEHGIGEFVVQDTALVSLALTDPPEQTIIDSLNSAFSIDLHRIVDQDPAFGIRQIVDIAMKALSPGVNDTSTAVMCVDYLTSIMARLSGRRFPPSYFYDRDALRVVAIFPSFEGLLSQAFDQIRSNAEDNVAILTRMLGALDTIVSLTVRLSHIKALDEQLNWIAEAAERSIESTHDRARIKHRLSEVSQTLKDKSIFLVESGHI